MTKRKQEVLLVPLTDVELNYIDSGLRKIVLEHKFDIYIHGEAFGNVQTLLNISERLQKKLSRLHHKWYRDRAGPSKWRKQQKLIRGIIKRAKGD